MYRDVMLWQTIEHGQLLKSVFCAITHHIEQLANISIWIWAWWDIECVSNDCNLTNNSWDVSPVEIPGDAGSCVYSLEAKYVTVPEKKDLIAQKNTTFW